MADKIDIGTLQIEYVPTETLKPYDKNAKVHDEKNINAIAESIREFGFDNPIGIWHDEIVFGHGRLLAAQKLKLDTVPVVRLDHLTEDQAKALRLADNQTTLMTGWDDTLLSEELTALGNSGLDMGAFGFDLGDAGTMTMDEMATVDDGYTPGEETPPIARNGDIWTLGNHRLMCGDSTNRNDVLTLMDGEQAYLFLTDPPYNVAVGSKNKVLNEKNHDKRGHRIEHEIEGDAGMTDEEIGQTLWEPAFQNALTVAEDACSCYITMPQGGTHMMMMMMMKEAGWQVKHELVWVKNMATFSLGRLDYDYKHEPILYGWNKSHRFFSENYEVSVMEEKVPDIENMGTDEMRALLKKLYSEKMPTSVFRYDKPLKSALHPTMKPVPLFGKLILNSTEEGDAVLDLFGGSGTTMIACEQTDRRCFMMELDPHYCDVIIERWEQFTGKKAELINRRKTA